MCSHSTNFYKKSQGKFIIRKNISTFYILELRRKNNLIHQQNLRLGIRKDMKNQIFFIGLFVGALLLLGLTRNTPKNFEDNPILGRLEVISIALGLIVILLSGITAVYIWG